MFAATQKNMPIKLNDLHGSRKVAAQDGTLRTHFHGHIVRSIARRVNQRVHLMRWNTWNLV
jgi:hypothetical protein